LKLRPEGLAWNKFPQAEAVLVYARGLGAARSGDVEAAKADLQRLQALKEAMTAAKIDYWPGQTDFQIKALSAWIALSENRNEEALQLMRAAADDEEATDKHPVTPGNVAPSRQLLGEMLLAAGRPQQALIEFERSLKRDPNRFRSIHGAAQAADEAGDQGLALDYYSKLQALAADRDSDRPELIQGRGFATTNKKMQHPY
jgi:tetratricopeptide (TPR) repeat protein